MTTANDPRRTARFLVRLSEHDEDEGWERLRYGLTLHSVQSVLRAVVELGDSDIARFEKATRAISRTGNPMYTRPLVRLMWENASKCGALMVATDSCDPYFCGLYLRALKDDDAAVRAMGAQALTWPGATWRSGQARRALLAMATNTSEDTFARWMAMQSLVSFPRPARIGNWVDAIVQASTVDSPVGRTAKVLVQRWEIDRLRPRDRVVGA